MAVRDSRVRNLTAWRLVNDRSSPGQKANIGTEFAGRDIPKMKFLFTVSFEFGEALSQYINGGGLNVGNDDMAKIEYACKNATRPNININYAEVNSYNYRYKVATKTDFGTVTLTLYDDNKNTAHDFLKYYLWKVSPVSTREAGTSYYTKENIQNWASLGPLRTADADGLIKTMRITHHYAENNELSARGHRMIHYDYINPKIQSFSLDDLDMTVSDVNTITFTFVYDSVNIVYDNGTDRFGGE